MQRIKEKLIRKGQNSRKQLYLAFFKLSELCTFQLGGYEQKVLIEGKSKELPVVVTLHGGPGTPIPLSVGCGR